MKVTVSELEAGEVRREPGPAVVIVTVTVRTAVLLPGLGGGQETTGDTRLGLQSSQPQPRPRPITPQLCPV